MAIALTNWFHDGDGWQFPDGRRREFLVLAVAFPVVLWYAQRTVGIPSPTDRPIVLVAGVLAGFVYATYARDRILDRVSDNTWTIVSTVVGGAGLRSLESIGVASPAVLFVLATIVTILLTYLVRLCSPVHDDLRPPQRGVEPPAGPDSSTDRR